MRRLLMTIMACLALVAFAVPAIAHEGHGATIGEVLSVSADGFQLKTAKETVTVKFSDKTAFELDKKPAEKSALKKGDRVAVTGTKAPSGEIVATKVVLGLPAPAAHPKPSSDEAA